MSAYHSDRSHIVLPVSVFDLSLSSYEAYDKERLPFLVDVTAFFRISDSNKAASRVHTFAELNDQLRSIVQGAVRSILELAGISYVLSKVIGSRTAVNVVRATFDALKNMRTVNQVAKNRDLKVKEVR